MTVENIDIRVKTNAGDAATQMKSLSNAMRGVKSTSKWITQTASSVKSVGDSAKKSTSFLGGMFSSLKRIAMYRAIRSALKAIAAAIKEGLENAYEYSKAINGSLAKSLDRLASKSQKLKNQLGAAFGEVIEAFEPFLSAVLDDLTEIAKTITSLFAMVGSIIKKLYELLKPVIDFALDLATKILSMLRAIFDYIGQIFGSDGYLVANDVEKSWKDADKAAKEYKRTLIGIDEINRLNEDNTIDYSDLFHVEPINKDGSNGGDSWAKPLLRDIDDGISGMQKLSEEAKTAKTTIEANKPVFDIDTKPAYAAIYSLAPAVEYALEPAYEYAYAFEYATEKVYALEPALDTVAKKTTLLEAVANSVIEAFIPLLDKLPILLTFKVVSPLPQLTTVVQRAIESVESFAEEYSSVSKRAKEYAKETGVSIRSLRQSAETDFDALGATLARWKQSLIEFKASVVEYGRMLDGQLGIYISRGEEKIKTFAANVKVGFAKFAPEFAASVLTTFAALATNMSPGLLMAREKLNAFLTSTFKGFSEWGTQTSQFFSNLWQSINNIINSIKSQIEAARGTALGRFFLGDGNTSATSNMPFIPAVPAMPTFIPAFATGGFPEDGLFYANHNELVGQFSDGRTAVANNEQIIDGISEGVAYGNATVVGAINQLIAVVQQIDPTVELDGLTVSRRLKKYESQVNREFGTSLAVEVGV